MLLLIPCVNVWAIGNITVWNRKDRTAHAVTVEPMNVARLGIDTPHELLSMLDQTIGIILRPQTMMLSHLLIPTQTFPARTAEPSGKSQCQWRVDRQRPPSLSKEQGLLRAETAMEILDNGKPPPTPEIVLNCAYMMYHMSYHSATKHRSWLIGLPGTYT